jgi:hypothetical protein
VHHLFTGVIPDNLGQASRRTCGSRDYEAQSFSCVVFQIDRGVQITIYEESALIAQWTGLLQRTEGAKVETNAMFHLLSDGRGSSSN